MGETEDVLKHLAELRGKFVMDDKAKELCHRANNPPLFIADPYLNMPEEAWAGFSLPSKADWIASAIPEYKKLAEELGDGPFFCGETPGYGEASSGTTSRMVCLLPRPRSPRVSVKRQWQRFRGSMRGLLPWTESRSTLLTDLRNSAHLAALLPLCKLCM